MATVVGVVVDAEVVGVVLDGVVLVVLDVVVRLLWDDTVLGGDAPATVVGVVVAVLAPALVGSPPMLRLFGAV